MSMPKWLKRENGAYVVDPDIAYPAIMDAIGFKKDEIDQYAVECAYQCTKMAVQNIAAANGDAGVVSIVIASGGGRKDRWSLAKFKPGVPGRDINAATKGLQAKKHYERIAYRIAL